MNHTMSRVFSAFLALCFLSSAEAAVWTYTQTAVDKDGIGYGTISDGVWTLYAKRCAKDSMDLTVSGLTEPGGGTGPAEGVVAPIDFTHVNDGFRVLKIGTLIGTKDAHYRFRNQISEIIAPDCIAIGTGQNAVSGCGNLTNLFFNAELDITGCSKVFSGNTKLVSFHPTVLKSSSIPYQGFQNCHRLKVAFTFPNCTSISELAFYLCRELQSVDAPNLTVVQKQAFYNCTNLTSLTTSSLNKLGSAAFRGCKKLELDLSASLGRSLTLIGNSATDMSETFLGCSSLKGPLVWDFPNLVTNVVSKSCFSGCSDLASVVFKTAVEEIRADAFYNIGPGAEVRLPAAVPRVYGARAFARDNVPFPKLYLKDNVEDWLAAISVSHHVLLKEDFNNNNWSNRVEVSCAHDDRVWSNMASAMALDTDMCESVYEGDGNKRHVVKVTVKDKRVIAFVLYHAGGNHKQSYCWILKEPGTGFRIMIR